MKRRTGIKSSDLKSTLSTLRQCGIQPYALDTMPDGTCRWHFTPPQQPVVNDLDRELAEFEARHGHD